MVYSGYYSKGDLLLFFGRSVTSRFEYEYNVYVLIQSLWRRNLMEKGKLIELLGFTCANVSEEGELQDIKVYFWIKKMYAGRGNENI